MAVIKTFDTTHGHLWIRQFFFPVTDVKSLIEVIKNLEDPTDVNYIEDKDSIEVHYIGEANLIDVDLSKIKCEACRKDLERLG